MDVRSPAVAGSFYPASATELRRQVEELLAQVAKPAVGNVVGLLSPHAGYIFSGAVAASAWKAVEGESYDAVVLIGPSHRIPLDHAALIVEGAYSTPLGILSVDSGLARQLVASGHTLQVSREAHEVQGRRGEHSLEVQLPFLQVALGDVPIVPVLMGSQRRASASDLARAIAAAAGDRKLLLVASSDLSHFHSDDEARAIDCGIRDAVVDFNPKQLYDNARDKGAEACGLGPLAAVMEASELLGANHAYELAYATSGDSPFADKASVVGYLSAIFVEGEGG